MAGNDRYGSTSSLESLVEHIGVEQEGHLIIQVLDMTLGETKERESHDSFSFDPGSDYNKGALSFLTLVEQAYAKMDLQDRNTAFEHLLIGI